MATGLVENLLRWDQLARLNVNQRAAELSLGHLIHIGDRVIKIAPTIPPVVNHWVAGTRLAGLVSPVIIGKRLFTPAIAPIPKVIVTSLITAPNALLLTAAGVAVERLAARALGPRRIAPPAAMRISSLKDGRCLTNGGLGLGFKRCGAAGTDEWRFERTSPRVPLTRKAVLGLIHGANGERFFAVAEPNAPGIWWPSSTPTVRLCADRWCVRSVSRGPNNFIVPLANAYVALAPISRYSGSSGLMALLPPAPAAADEIPLAVYAMVLVAVALVTLALAKRLVESWTHRNDAAIAAQRALEKTVREKKLPEHLRLGVTLPGMRKLLSELPSDALEQVNANIPKDKVTGEPKFPENLVFNGYANQYHITLREKRDQLTVCERLQSQKSPHVGEATVFVSWFLETKIATLLDALGHFLEQKGLPEADTFFWVCDNVIRQTKVGPDLWRTWATASAPSGTRCCCSSRGTTRSRSSAPTASRRSTTPRRAARRSTW